MKTSHTQSDSRGCPAARAAETHPRLKKAPLGCSWPRARGAPAAGCLAPGGHAAPRAPTSGPGPGAPGSAHQDGTGSSRSCWEQGAPRSVGTKHPVCILPASPGVPWARAPELKADVGRPPHRPRRPTCCMSHRCRVRCQGFSVGCEHVLRGPREPPTHAAGSERHRQGSPLWEAYLSSVIGRRPNSQQTAGTGKDICHPDNPWRVSWPAVFPASWVSRQEQRPRGEEGADHGSGRTEMGHGGQPTGPAEGLAGLSGQSGPACRGRSHDSHAFWTSSASSLCFCRNNPDRNAGERSPNGIHSPGSSWVPGELGWTRVGAPVGPWRVALQGPRTPCPSHRARCPQVAHSSAPPPEIALTRVDLPRPRARPLPGHELGLT